MGLTKRCKDGFGGLRRTRLRGGSEQGRNTPAESGQIAASAVPGVPYMDMYDGEVSWFEGNDSIVPLLGCDSDSKYSIANPLPCHVLPFSSSSDSALVPARVPFITPPPQPVMASSPPLHHNGSLPAPPRQPRTPCPALPCPPRTTRHQALPTCPRYVPPSSDTPTPTYPLFRICHRLRR